MKTAKKPLYQNLRRIKLLEKSIAALTAYYDITLASSFQRRQTREILQSQREMLKDELHGWVDEPPSRWRCKK